MAVNSMNSLWGIVPAGGAGTRLWPVSRVDHPKFLGDLTGTGQSMIAATVARLTPLVDDRLLVVTGAAHVDAVRAQLPGLTPDHLLAEPSPRDSAAAIALAAAIIERRDPDAIVGSFAADHVIPDPEPFHRCIREAAEVALQDLIVTVGIEPTGPATNFGYIELGEPLWEFPTAHQVVQFVEKPDPHKAAAYLATGRFRWNAGMFVAKATVLLDLLAQWHPDLADGVRAIAANPQELHSRWDALERIAIDHALAEPAAEIGKVAVVPGPFGWDDVGGFDSLSELIPPTSTGPSVIGDASLVTAQDSSGLIIPQSGRHIAVVGIPDVVIVDTPDAVLVTTREHAQSVKDVVAALREAGLDHLV